VGGPLLRIAHTFQKTLFFPWVRGGRGGGLVGRVLHRGLEEGILAKGAGHGRRAQICDIVWLRCGCMFVLQSVAMRCSVLQCVVECCIHARRVQICDIVSLRCGCIFVLHCVALCCSGLRCIAVCCSVLQCVAVFCSVLQRVAVCCSVLQCVAARHEACRCAT